ncbi:helix-turn-helix domain-containing protein [Nitrosospira sp. NpAV]|uniref:helix-turn-helix domain-containing protein n=1 Tax=Nitrosospira sp. NpAV TaxID=58133 RepID=UPI0012EBAFF2|nr:hypothetical protein [Nitrosospira sp. NpAV]
MQENLNSFAERLKAILGERNKHHWGIALGIGRGTIGNTFNGSVPTSEALNAISRSENVSTTWLLEGREDPYYVRKFTDDDECVNYLDAVFLERWTIYLVTDQKHLAVALTMPAQYKIKEEWVSYTPVEVLAGRCGRKTLATGEKGIAFLQGIRHQRVSADLDNLSHNKIGTYKLLNAEQPLLNQDMLAKRNQKIFDWPEETMSLTPEEHILIESFPPHGRRPKSGLQDDWGRACSTGSGQVSGMIDEIYFY